MTAGDKAFTNCHYQNHISKLLDDFSSSGHLKVLETDPGIWVTRNWDARRGRGEDSNEIWVDL